MGSGQFVRAVLEAWTSISTGQASPAYGDVGSYGTSQQGVLVRAALATKENG